MKIDKTQDPIEELPVVQQPPVSTDVRFRDLLLELIMDVVNGELPLPTAKHKLYSFIDSLSEEAQDELMYNNKITVVSKRIRDIADTLTAETPSLLAKIRH